MKTLILSIQELRAVAAFSGDLEYKKIEPHLRTSQLFLARYTGRQLLEELGTSQPTEKQSELLQYVRVPMGNLALMKYVGTGSVLITDLGVMRSQTANAGDAFEWQTHQTLTALKGEVYDGLEALLRYLDEKIDDFPAYKDSKQYNLLKGQLIRSAEVFNQYYEIGASRLVFETLQSAMLTAEIRLIRPILGNNLPGLLGANLTEQQQLQLDGARRALVYATMARALRERLVSITDQGVQVKAISDTLFIRYQQAPSDKQLETVLNYFDQEASTYLADLVTSLNPTPSGPKGGQFRGGKIVAF